MNLPYHFNDPDRSVVFERYDMPSAWINYLSNGTLHAYISQAGGGFAWWRSPITYRLTRYRMYNMPIDSPGFYIYIKNPDGTIWSPSFRPCETPLESWESKHQPGRTTFKAQKDGIEAILSIYIAPDIDSMIWDLNLKNTTGASVDLDVFGYVELSQYVWLQEVTAGQYNKWMVRVDFDKESDSIMYLNHFEGQPVIELSPMLYFGSNKKCVSFEGNRDKFCGNYRSERNPISVEKGSCTNSEMRGGEGCAAMQVKVTLGAGQEDKVHFFLGVVPGALKDYKKAVLDTREALKKLRSAGYVEEQSKKLSAWWEEHLDVLQCEVPEKDTERQVNTWNPTQSVHTGRYSRSISQNSPGTRGLGYRDTCQDMLAIAYRKPEWAKEIFLYLLTQQYEEGNTVFVLWPEDNCKPYESLRSDVHLWLHLLAKALISETGDVSLLDKKLPFLSKDLLSPAGEATVFEHLVRALDFTENRLGSHGLPLIFVSDWNDHFGSFGIEGRGETTMAAQQYVVSLRITLEFAKIKNDSKSVEKLQKLLDKQIKAINDYAWDGEWWMRGRDDDGNPVGTHSAEFGKIFLESQSWAVLGMVSDNERLSKAMDSVKNLLDSDYGVRLNGPAFPTWPETDKPAVKGLPPGCAENGGVFCHANTWTIIAESMLGRAENAWKYYRQLIPHVALQRVGIQNYIAEPYAYVSTIFGPENVRQGWANVTQVTGTAAWMDVAATQYLLGIRPEIDGLLIDPCIPKDWKGFSAHRIFRGCRINLEFTNNGVSKGVSSIVVNGENLDISKSAMIPASMIEGKKSLDVKVTLG
jgi:cellobiose phosphorylase